VEASHGWGDWSRGGYIDANLACGSAPMMGTETKASVMCHALIAALAMTTLVDFASATPAPLTLHLLPLAPLIHHARHLADVLSWSAPWEESALLLALWWALCLFSELTLQYVPPCPLARAHPPPGSFSPSPSSSSLPSVTGPSPLPRPRPSP